MTLVFGVLFLLEVQAHIPLRVLQPLESNKNHLPSATLASCFDMVGIGFGLFGIRERCLLVYFTVTMLNMREECFNEHARPAASVTEGNLGKKQLAELKKII